MKSGSFSGLVVGRFSRCWLVCWARSSICLGASGESGFALAVESLVLSLGWGWWWVGRFHNKKWITKLLVALGFLLFGFLLLAKNLYHISRLSFILFLSLASYLIITIILDMFVCYKYLIQQGITSGS